MLEEWKNCKSHSDYMVSSFGRLKNAKTGKILKIHNNGRGYAVYTSRGKRIRIHREVAENFVPNPALEPVVNHKDGNKQNNVHYNLEWVSFSENTSHAWSNGLIKSRAGSSGSRAAG